MIPQSFQRNQQPVSENRLRAIRVLLQSLDFALKLAYVHPDDHADYRPNNYFLWIMRLFAYSQKIRFWGYFLIHSLSALFRFACETETRHFNDYLFIVKFDLNASELPEEKTRALTK